MKTNVDQALIGLTYCAICEADRCDAGCPSGWPGEERVGTPGGVVDTWICLDCLSAEPCVECGGEHHHSLPCDAVADPRRFVTDADGAEVEVTWGELYAANSGDVGAMLEIGALRVGDGTVIGQCTTTRRIA